MRCGLFGKLAKKRDFIAIGTPQNFLEVWEPWLQASVSASRHQLDSAWQHAFLTAPLWRFWLGADIAGVTILGTMMPSVDGVGRYYPLTLLAVASQGSSIAPPDLNSQSEWFSAAENLLLSTLDETVSFADISNALELLAGPTLLASRDRSPDVIPIGTKMLGLVSTGRSFESSLFLLRHANYDTLASTSFWWTEGGAGFPPIALCAKGLPDPFSYSTLLTGKLPNNEPVDQS